MRATVQRAAIELPASHRPSEISVDQPQELAVSRFKSGCGCLVREHGSDLLELNRERREVALVVSEGAMQSPQRRSHNRAGGLSRRVGLAVPPHRDHQAVRAAWTRRRV